MFVGVFETSSGLFRLVDDGDLPEAIAASCAIPYIFQPVLAGNPPTLMAGTDIAIQYKSPPPTPTHPHSHSHIYIHTNRVVTTSQRSIKPSYK